MNNNSSTPSSEHTPTTLPLALLLAWICPGLGHAFIGEKKRGLALAITIITLFVAGLLVGSIDVIDRKNDHLWFIGQSMIGPAALAIDQLRYSLETPQGNSVRIQPTPQSPYHRSIGRVNEIGTLYTTLAGVLNLLAILDLLGRVSANAPSKPSPQPVSSDPPRGTVVTRENP